MCQPFSTKLFEIPAERATKPTLARLQLSLAAALLVLIVLATLLLDAMAHSGRLASWLYYSEQNICRHTRKIFTHSGYFVDCEDRLIYDELPRIDFSRGGVYLFGSSNLKWATRFWELPATERSLLHNFGIGETDHTCQRQLLEYLIERCGMLRAGGEKSMVIFGLSYHDIRSGTFFPSLWQRHGLYRYDSQLGITPVETTRVQRFLKFERLRISGCLNKLGHALFHSVTWHWHDPPRRLNPTEYNRLRSEWLGPNWQATMGQQIQEFARTTDYLLARNVPVIVVLLPQGSWEDNLPFEPAYKEQIQAVCRSREIKILDWSKMLDDEDFADSNHPNLYGMDKLQDAFLQLGLPFLRSTGALP